MMNKDEEKRQDCVGKRYQEACFELIRTIIKMIKNANLPSPRYQSPFPHAASLLQWILDKPHLNFKDPLFAKFLNIDSGEGAAISRAEDLNEALSVLDLSWPSIPAWEEFIKARSEFEKLMNS